MRTFIQRFFWRLVFQKNSNPHDDNSIIGIFWSLGFGRQLNRRQRRILKEYVAATPGAAERVADLKNPRWKHQRLKEMRYHEPPTAEMWKNLETYPDNNLQKQPV